MPPPFFGILFVFLILSNIVVFSQKYDNNWILGYEINGITPNEKLTNISFDKKVLINIVKSSLSISFSNTTMSDSLGNLLYYSNGCRIFNRNHKLMENGDNITFGRLREILCSAPEIGIRGPQSMMSIQDPYRDSIYYMYYTNYDFYVPYDGRITISSMLRTTINMNIDNGNGAIIEKNKIILKDSVYNFNLVSVKHANNRDWWIIQAQGRKEQDTDSSNLYFKLLVTKDSIITYKQNIGDSTKLDYSNIKFTNDGKKILRYIRDNGLYIYNFDRSTGEISNQKLVKVPKTKIASIISVASSPNSRFAYCIQYDTIFQYDLESSDIQASQVLVAVWDGFRFEGEGTIFSDAQLGPDCKIYIASYNAIPYYHFIRYPDRKGLACEVVQHGLFFGDKQWNDFTIPYYPNYRQHLSYPCDSNIVISGTEAQSPIWEHTLVYPNPASDYITIRGQFDFKQGQFVLYNAIGKQVLTHELHDREQEYTIPIRTLPVGMYFYHIEDDSGTYRSSGKVEVVR